MILESPNEMNITSWVFHQANEKQNYILMKRTCYLMTPNRDDNHSLRHEFHATTKKQSL